MHPAPEFAPTPQLCSDSPCSLLRLHCQTKRSRNISREKIAAALTCIFRHSVGAVLHSFVLASELHSFVSRSSSRNRSNSRYRASPRIRIFHDSSAADQSQYVNNLMREVLMALPSLSFTAAMQLASPSHAVPVKWQCKACFNPSARQLIH